MRNLYAALATMLLIAGCSTAESDAPATTTPPETVATTTTTVATTTTTTEPPTTVTITAPPPATTKATTTTEQVSDLDESREYAIEVIIGTFEAWEYDRVDVIVFDDKGTLTIEGRLQWASEDRQEDTHWETVQILSEWFGSVEYAVNEWQFGGDPIVHLTTVSTNGDYRYQSWTSHESFVEILDRRMGLDAWKEASDAGFQ